MYGYNLDGSDFPCYLLWPKRTPTVLPPGISKTQRYVDIEHAGFLHPLGLRHFYDGFSLRAEISIRLPALEAFQLQEFFFLAQPNERLSIVGHLDTSAIMIKKMPAAHAKHRTKHKQQTQTTTTQHNKETARAVGKVKKGETVSRPKRPQ